MNYFLEHWGDFASLLGFIITIAGLSWAIRSAREARKSATAAEAASIETREAITRVLTIVDLERAVALIQRLKVLHREKNWESGLEHYQTLRAMLADIDAKHPALTPELHTTLREAIVQIKVIEDSVDRTRDAEPSGARNFNEVLNAIQVSLEETVSSAHFSGREAGR